MASAAEATRKTFDLAADAADRALKQLSIQSGFEVIYSSNLTRNVTTNQVKGDFTPKEAIDRMLAGTGLVGAEDKSSASFTVRKETPAEEKNGPRAAQPTASDRPTRPSAATGKIAPDERARDATRDSDGDSAVALSPFVVSSSKDTGYQATSTLAGTRLNTPVKDLGASISIYTKDFLEDIGATSSSDLLIYATGMEAAGAGGNFSGATADINSPLVLGDAPRVDPQQGSRTRGLSAPNFTRGFFTTDIATDSYNVENVTVNRGPNAILFGAGSPAGVVESSLLRPNLRRNANKVEARYGDNDSHRGVVDFNRVLVPNKLALRLAALNDSERFNQRPAFEQKERVYGALAFEPYRSTALRLNFESGRTRANRPITVLPFDSISPYWYEEGRRGFDWSFYDDPARNPNAAAQNASNYIGFLQSSAHIADFVVVVHSTPSGPADLAFRGVTPNTAANAANAVKNQVFQPLVNRDLAADAIGLLGTRNIGELPAGFWTGSRVFPGQQPNSAPAGLKMQGFVDFNAFDFENRMIDETSRQGDNFRAFNIALEQRAWADRIGVEVAYDTQRVDRRARNSFFSAGGTNNIRINTSVTLPTGQPNPNFGRPYAVYGQTSWTNNYSDRETVRATGYLRYDFRALDKPWARWLGRHSLTGLYEHNAVEAISYSTRLATDGAAATALNPNVSVFARRPAIMVFLGPSIIGNTNPLRLEPIRTTMAPGPTVDASYFVRQANATDPGAFVRAPASLVEIANPGSAQREVIKSQAATLQSYWLQEHLITLVGWRRDEDYFVRENISFVANPADLNDPGKVHCGFDDFSFPRTPPPNVVGETLTYSGVLRWPRHLYKLPGGADLSVFYNNSENFTPTGGRVSAFNEALASPSGKTEEYGFNLALLHDKLNLRVNRFVTAVTGATSNTAAFGSIHNNAITQQATLWAIEANINPGNVPFMNAAIERLLSPLPPDFLALRNFAVQGTAPNLSSAFSSLAGQTDTTDFVARGTEIELVYNPTRNWRILANVAKQETVRANSFPGTKKLLALMTPVWNSTITDPRTGAVVKMGDIPRNGYPLGTGPANPPPAGTELYGDWLDRLVHVPFATASATEGSASAEQRKWRFNLVTNYSFRRGSIFGGRLDGWSIGGAVRWQDKLGIGYPTTRHPDGTVNIDIAHPYYAPAETNVDAWVSYQRKIWKDRINWKVQLNIRNLVADSVPIAIGVQPWGEVSTVRLAPERRWYLTNTFSF